jgi:hypothetical protein
MGKGSLHWIVDDSLEEKSRTEPTGLLRNGQ